MANIQNPYGREHQLLNGDWATSLIHMRPAVWICLGTNRKPVISSTAHQKTTGQANIILQPLKIPGDWNSQEKQLRWYEGTVWFHSALPDAADVQAR